MFEIRRHLRKLCFLTPLVLLISLTACGRDPRILAAGNSDSKVVPSETAADSPGAPSGLVTVSAQNQTLEFWPYTGMGLDGVPSDPINLVLTGKADPVQIRQALLNLDGNRTAFGFPDQFPFNARWSDAQGDAQATWTGAEGWVGSVIQLQLGDFTPIRAHLRLFRTGKTSEDGEWTLGAAHFEVLIPGTADHQVLSWELAEQLVTVDLIRSGLLGGGLPSGPTGAINQAPSFREIPDFIYNSLPPPLIAAIGGPPAPVSGPVPILSDGRATMFHLVNSVPIVAGTMSHAMTIDYAQAVPKPFCATGPLDWVMVQGPVEFKWTTTVDETGRAEVQSDYRGTLTITPVDVTVNPPQPAGASYPGEVSGLITGFTDSRRSELMAWMKRIAPQTGGTEMLMVRLRAGAPGLNSYRVSTKCLSPAL